MCQLLISKFLDYINFYNQRCHQFIKSSSNDKLTTKWPLMPYGTLLEWFKIHMPIVQNQREHSINPHSHCANHEGHYVMEYASTGHCDCFVAHSEILTHPNMPTHILHRHLTRHNGMYLTCSIIHQCHVHFQAWDFNSQILWLHLFISSWLGKHISITLRVTRMDSKSSSLKVEWEEAPYCAWQLSISAAKGILVFQRSHALRNKFNFLGLAGSCSFKLYIVYSCTTKVYRKRGYDVGCNAHPAR